MNIGFFSETYLPEINGGVTAMLYMKEELERMGHTVYVFTAGHERFSLKGQPQRERHIFRFNSFSYPLYKSIRVAVPLDWPIQRKIPKLKLDVIHAHTPFSMGLFALAVSRQQHLPFVHTYHTLYPEYAKFYFPGFDKWNEKATEKLSAVFCNFADKIIAPSDGIRQKLLKYGVKVPITTLPTGVPREFFGAHDKRGTIRRRYHIPARAPLLITVARLGREKSLDFTLRAFQQVRRYHPDAWYLIIGEGPDRLELETLARELGVIDHTVLAGFITKREEVAAAYAAADIFMFASRTETQCLTLLEGAATGLPLVAVRDKPLETSLHHNVNGFFTEPNANKFAFKVQRLLTDKALARRFGRASIKIARAQSAAKQVEKLVALYEETIAQYTAKYDGQSARLRKVAGKAGRGLKKLTPRKRAGRAGR